MKRELLVALGVAVVGLVLVLGLAGLPSGSGAVLGAGPELPGGIWGLWYTATHLVQDGLHTTLLQYPDGGRVWPGPVLEGLVLAPITWVLGPAAAWNLLVALRVLGAGLGGALLLQRRGLNPGFGLLVAACPPLLQALSAGEGLGAAVAWAPLAVVLLGANGLPAAIGATVLLATAPGAWLVGLVLGLALVPERVRSRQGVVVFGLSAVPWLLQLSTRVAGPALLGAGGSPGAPLDPGRHGDLLGLVGLGDARPFGGLVLLLALVALRPGASAVARRGLALVSIGLLAALGPVLVIGARPLALLDRSVPLPLSLLDGLPPLSLLGDLASLGLLAWVGLALVLGDLARGRPWVLVALVGLVQAPSPSWTVPPQPFPGDAAGPVLHYPLEQEPWSLVAQTVHGQPISHGPRGAVAGLEELVGREAWTPAELQDWAQDAGFDELVVDREAAWGQALELAGVLGAHRVALDDKQWPGILLQEHAFDNARPIDPLPESPPKEPTSWTFVDPLLEPLMNEELAEVALTRVYVYGSEDGGQTWQLRDTPVIHSLTTLGLTVVKDRQGNDEALVISGLSDFDQATGYHFRGTHPATVLALTTPDLERWGFRRYEIDQALAVVDPHLEWRREELQLVAWTSDRLGVDPMLLSGPHPVFIAGIDRNGRYHITEPVIDTPRLADPTMAGDLLLYTFMDIGESIQESIRIAAPQADGSYADVAELDGVSVPFAWKDGETWRLLAHGTKTLPDGARGPMTVVEATSTDAITWSDFREVQGLRPGPCESPVAGRFRGDYVLICSERLR